MNKLRLTDLLKSFALTLDVISPDFYLQHMQVAYLSQSMGRAAGFSDDVILRLIQASLIRDVGILSLGERQDLQRFQAYRTDQHCHVGQLLLSQHKALAHLAPLVQHHHTIQSN